MHVEPRPVKKYTWYARLLLWLQKRRYGQPLLSSLVWARTPKPFLAFSFLFGVLERKKSPVCPKIRALVRTRISQVTSCAFCIDWNGSKMLELGESQAKLLALQAWGSSPLYNGRERAVLTYAEEMIDPNQTVADTTVSALRRYYDEDGLVELTAVIATQLASTAFNRALAIPAMNIRHENG